MATNANTYPPPQRLQSKAGYWFCQDAPVWELDKNTNVSIQVVRDNLDHGLIEGFTATLAHFACTMSASYTMNISVRLLAMLRINGHGRIDSNSLIHFRKTLTRQTEWHLGAIRGFLYKWHDLGYQGITEDVIDLLKSWTLKGCIKGDRVKRLDPTQGPLTDNELQAFNEGAVRAFEKGLISVTDLAISLIESNSGRRPIQITHIKLCDLEANGRNRKGEVVRLIRIPRAKQQGEGFRASFKVFPLSEELWIVIHAQKRHCIGTVEQCLGYKLDEKTRLALPLFPDLASFDDLRSSNAPLSELLQTDHLHLKSRIVTQVLNNVVQLSDCHSERTGDVLNVFATRFRYTVGTRAAREGLGPMIIAELLDHTDTQQADVYSKNVPEHAAILDKKLSALLAPYARAFQGIIVEREEDAKRGNDLCSRIRHHGEGAGICGSDGSCGANVPIPCYTCFHFQALLDGPHERVLSELYSERQRILDLTGDEFVAGANDRTISAVEQVIQRCREAGDQGTRREDDKSKSDVDRKDNNSGPGHAQKEER